MRILRRKPILVVIMLCMMAIMFVLPFQDLYFVSAFALGVMFSVGAAIVFIFRFFWLWSISSASLQPIRIRGRNRYWVESDENLIMTAIKIIVCTDAGFSVSILDQAFARDNKKVALSIMRMTRIDNRDDKFVVRLIAEGKYGTLVSEETHCENVNDAVEVFINVWKDWQIGEEWINIHSPKFTMFS